MRVYNGPGPNSNSSDDRAMDIVVADNGEEVWLTGTVHEADGTGYDTMTIRYDAFNQPGPDPHQEVTIDLSATSENAIAMVAVELAYPGEVYVTGTIQAGIDGEPLIQTFKILSGGSTVPNWIRLFGNAISDFPAAIIAPTRNDGSISVMVFGRSFYYGGTSYDQVGVHYTQPPP